MKDETQQVLLNLQTILREKLNNPTLIDFSKELEMSDDEIFPKGTNLTSLTFNPLSNNPFEEVEKIRATVGNDFSVFYHSDKDRICVFRNVSDQQFLYLSSCCALNYGLSVDDIYKICEQFKRRYGAIVYGGAINSLYLKFPSISKSESRMIAEDIRSVCKDTYLLNGNSIESLSDAIVLNNGNIDLWWD